MEHIGGVVRRCILVFMLLGVYNSARATTEVTVSPEELETITASNSGGVQHSKLLSHLASPLRMQDDGFLPTRNASWGHRKLLGDFQAKAADQLFYQQNSLIFLGGGLVLVAFVAFCGACFSSPKAKEDSSYKSGSPNKGVQLQYRSTSNAASSKPVTPGRPSRGSHEQPTASGSLKSTGSENGHPVVPPSRFASSSVEAPGTPPQPMMTAPADRVRPADSRDSLGAQSSKSLGHNSVSKPPLPGLTDPTKSRELRQLPLVVGAQRDSRDSKDSFKSPWETSGEMHSVPADIPARVSSSVPKLQQHASAESGNSTRSLGPGEPSGEIMNYPPALGRRYEFRIRGAKEREFSPEEEDHEAGVLENAAAIGRAAFVRNHPEAAEGGALTLSSTRVRLSDVKLKAKDGKPISLGEGGFGKVLLGSLHKEDCAVKTILEGSRKEQARFLREIRLLEKLHTQHITRYMGWSVCPEGFVLLMEYMPGGTLTRALALDDSEYQYYKRGKEAMLSIALAVNHLHARRIAHLDMKSPNILLSKDGLAKLADVGLSRLVKQDATALSMPGTFSWASPEQTEGRAGLPADIWAFGTILWEVCTCEKPPFNRFLRDIEVPEEAPQEVVDLLHLCHSKEPKDRPVAADLYDALEACPWPEAAPAAVQGS